MAKRLRRPFESFSVTTPAKDKPRVSDRLRVSAPKRKKPVAADSGGNFGYVAVNQQGTRQKGKMRAPSAQAVAEALSADGWTPLSVEKIATGGLNTDLGALLGSDKFVLNIQELATFSRQFSELLRAGVPVSRALISLGEEADARISRVCEGLSARVNSGVPLSEAMEEFPGAFDEVFRSYVAAGETSGTLAHTMGRLSQNMERRATLQRKIKAVTAYPKFVSIAIGLIVVAIFTILIPKFEAIYAGFNSELPAPTQFVVTLSQNLFPVSFDVTAPVPWYVSDGLSLVGAFGRLLGGLALFGLLEMLRNLRRKPFKPVGVGLKTVFVLMCTIFAADYEFNPVSSMVWGAGVAVVLGLFFATRAGETNIRLVRLVDIARFRMPLLGNMNKLNTLYRWTSTLAGAMEAGVPLARAVELAGQVSGSRWHRLAASELQSSVRAGKPLSEGLLMYPELFPASLRAMVATGEQTGDLAVMLDSAAKTIESEVDAIIAGLAAKLEVALLVLLATVVGGLIVVMYLPILNLASTGYENAVQGR